MVIKIGNCYIARFTKIEMPVRIESQKENGIWRTRSLTHGRVVFVKNESQIVRECNDSDLVEYAKTTMPNRRSKKQKQQLATTSQQLPTETPVAARVRKVKAKRPNVPEFGLTLVEAAYRILKQSKRPLTSQEIVDQALARKMHHSSGATPANSINAAILRIIKRDGDNSRFVRVGRGLFAAR